MSEQLSEPVEVLSLAFSQWLNTEKASSLNDNNAVLNEFSSYENSQGLAYNDPSNAFTTKGLGHYGRLKRRTAEFADEAVIDDKFLGLQMFDALMSVSGHYRLQCVVAANSERRYMGLRYRKAPAGIDIHNQVDQRFNELFGGNFQAEDLGRKVLSYCELIQSTNAVNENRHQLMKQLFDRRHIKGIRKAIYATRLADSQKPWIDLATDYAVFAAQKHQGVLAKVPFFEPKSITYSKLVYPLEKSPPYFEIINQVSVS